MSIPETGTAPSCAICFNPFGNGAMVVLHKHDQGHTFHEECAAPWLELNDNCPLCRRRVTVLQDTSDEVFESAVKDVDIQFFEAFLDDHGEMSSRQRALGVLAAAKGGSSRLAQKLLTGDPVSEEHRAYLNHSLGAAVQGGHLPIVQALLATGLIEEGFRETGVRYGAVKGHLPIVQALLAWPISEEGRGQAVLYASRGNHLEIARVLLATGSISEVDRGTSVLVAAEKGNIALVQALLASGPISEKHRRLSVEAARNHGHLAIAELLEVKGFNWEIPLWILAFLVSAILRQVL